MARMTELPRRRNWFARNWKWLVPVGCLVPLLMCTGIVVLLFTVVFGAIKSSDPYQAAINAAQSSPAATASLGSPIKPGLIVTGEININGSSGDVDLAIPVSGPKGKGTIYVAGHRSAGKWTYTTLELAVPGSTERTPLLQPLQPEK